MCTYMMDKSMVKPKRGNQHVCKTLGAEEVGKRQKDI